MNKKLMEEVEEQVESQEEVEEETEEQPEPEEVDEDAEPTSEDEVDEEPVVVEKKKRMVPVDALQDERKKRQELEGQLKHIQQSVDSLRTQAPPKDIYEAYDRDSAGVMRDLNAEIKKLSTEDAYGNAAQIETLRDLKEDFRRREFQNIQKQLNQQTLASQVVNAVTRQIPDFQSKIKELEQFAINELDYTPYELAARVDPSLGETAVKEIVRINKLYDRFNAKPQSKAVKAKPTQVEGAGKGVRKAEPNLANLLTEAQRTGNWEPYFDAKGLLEE